MFNRFLYNSHAVFVALLCLWAPVYLGTGTVSATAVYSPLIVIIPISIYLWLKYKTRVSSWEMIAFQSIIAGITYAGLNTHMPLISPENFPPLDLILPVSGLLFAFWILVLQRMNHRTEHIGLWVTLYSSNLLFSQTLDKYPHAIIFPFLAILMAWTASLDFYGFRWKSGLSSIRGPVLILVTMITVWIVRGWSTQSSTFYIDTILLLTGILTFDLLWQSVVRRSSWVEPLLFCWSVLIVLLLSGLAVWRCFWLADQYGLTVVPRFKLWLSMVHPNAIGAFIAGTLPLLLMFGMVRKRYLPRIGITVLSIFLLLGTLSRGSWLASMLGLLIFIIIFYQSMGTGIVALLKRRTVLAAICVVVISGVCLIGAVTYRLFDAETIHARATLWKVSAQGIVSESLMGHGIGNHGSLAEYVLNQTSDGSTFLKEWYQWDRLGRHFHSLLFEIPWIFGFPGLFLFLACVVLLTYSVWKHRSSLPVWGGGAFICFMILFLTGIADCVFYYPALLILAAVCLGIASGHVDLLNQRHRLQNVNLHSKLKTVLLIFLFTAEVTGILVPALGSHWKVRGIEKKEKEPMWALSAFEKAFYYRPWDVDIAREMIQLHLFFNQPEKVVDKLRYIQKIRPEDPEAGAILAWLSVDQEDRLAKMQAVVDIDPAGLNGREYYSDLGILLCSVDRANEARRNLRQAYMADPYLPSKLVQVFSRIPDGVIARTDRMIEYLRRRYDVGYFASVVIPEIRIPVDDILIEMEQEIGLSPTPGFSDEARIHLIRSYISLGQFESAVRLMNLWNLKLADMADRKERITVFEEDSPEHAIMLAEKSMKLGDYSEAELYYRKSLKNGLNHPRIHFGLGKIAMHRKDWLESISAFEKASEMAPEFSEVHENLGILYMKLRRTEEAKVKFKQALALNPYAFEPLKQLGGMYLAEKKVEKALHLSKRAYRIDPGDHETLILLDECLTAKSVLKEHDRILQRELREKLKPLESKTVGSDEEN
jgi:Tfp pilus assembly protein PilF/O-antigen ligase